MEVSLKILDSDNGRFHAVRTVPCNPTLNEKLSSYDVSQGKFKQVFGKHQNHPAVASILSSHIADIKRVSVSFAE
ncbi:MAG: hypothetical protein FWG73_01020 [Planctomycetaceae bacterium]|nr:hypothetical protein [Planctomycetaceae bacterium]